MEFLTELFVQFDQESLSVMLRSVLLLKIDNGTAKFSCRYCYIVTESEIFIRTARLIRQGSLFVTPMQIRTNYTDNEI